MFSDSRDLSAQAPTRSKASRGKAAAGFIITILKVGTALEYRCYSCLTSGMGATEAMRMASRPEAIEVSAQAMAELRKAVGEFNSWRFYDCHETLEDVWRELGGKSGRVVPERGAGPDPAPLKPRQEGGQASAAPGGVADFLQGIIKAAAGFHHVLRGNHKGAVNLLSDSLRLLEAYRPECLAIDVERLVVEVEACLGRIEELGAERLEEFERGMIPRIEWVDVIGH